MLIAWATYELKVTIRLHNTTVNRVASARAIAVSVCICHAIRQGGGSGESFVSRLLSIAWVPVSSVSSGVGGRHVYDWRFGGWRRETVHE